MGHEMEIVNKGAEQSSTSRLAEVPSPRVPITIRPAVLSDLPFIDSLQKKQSKQVGWFPTKTIEGKIAALAVDELKGGQAAAG